MSAQSARAVEPQRGKEAAGVNHPPLPGYSFGSIIAFTAYIWLLQVSTPARVSTYAFVNPVVAIFLGWAILDEALTGQMLLAAAVIVVAVVIITVNRSN